MDQFKLDLEQFGPDPSSPEGHAGCAACGHTLPHTGDKPQGDGIASTPPTTAVRFGFLRYLGQFTHTEDLRFSAGSRMVIQTMRGIEIGQHVPLTCSGCKRAVSPEKLQDWVEQCSEGAMIFGAGRILREATAADLSEFAHIQSLAPERRKFCQALADRHGLGLRVVDCETLFGGERIIFYFTAAERVDFRGLVRELAKEYRTRIEMRQVGARDEARLLADFETCGREVCCKVFLKTLKQISMKMAKVQKATLDPSQVSGRCGRLKCCLRYEHEEYETLDKMLPRIGTRVNTNHGEGVVVNRQILTQLIQIRTDSETLVAVGIEDVLPPGVKPKKVAPKPVRKPTRRSEPRTRGGGGGAEDKADGKPEGKTEGDRKKAGKRRPKRSTKARRGRGSKPQETRDTSESQGEKGDGASKAKSPPPKRAAGDGESGSEQGAARPSRRRRRPRGRRGRGGQGPSKPGDGGGSEGPKE